MSIGTIVIICLLGAICYAVYAQKSSRDRQAQLIENMLRGVLSELAIIRLNSNGILRRLTRDDIDPYWADLEKTFSGTTEGENKTSPERAK